MTPIKVAMLIPDNRDEFGNYDDPDPVMGPAPAALLEGLSELTDLEVHILSCAKKPLRAPEKLARNIFFHLLLVGQWGWLRSAYSGCILALRRKLSEIKPDIVHGQGTERYCALATAFSRFPNVITIHGNMRAIAEINHAKAFSYQWCAARLEEFTLPRVGGVVCLTDYTRANVSKKASRTWVIPNAVSNGYFKVEPTSSESVDLLCVGTIIPRKNQNTLIRALDSLAGRYNFRLIFLGAGSEADEYFREFSELIKTREWCVHEGFVPPEQFQVFLSRATALILPSLEDNCPMVVIEAAAAGVPVLAANVGGVPTLIKDSQNGLLFDPNDAVSIARVTERYLSDREFARKMAANGRELAKSTFQPLVVAQRHLDVYREIIART
jgi:glycosyltransferase involved in cell wall biosynthesis